jgi:hypothetical protein
VLEDHLHSGSRSLRIGSCDVLFSSGWRRAGR